MKVGITVREGRVSPLLDTARCLMTANIEASEVSDRREWLLNAAAAYETINQLRGLGVELLICGAVSEPLAVLLASSRMKLISFVSGEVEEVLKNIAENGVCPQRFLMPGCGRGRRMGHRRGHGGDSQQSCVCSECGETEPHQRGVPCSQSTCPNCGARMRRGIESNARSEYYGS